MGWFIFHKIDEKGKHLTNLPPVRCFSLCSFTYSDFPFNLYLEQLILTLARLNIKRNVVFIDICFTSKTHPLLRNFATVAFGSCDSKGSVCFSYTGNAIFCMRRNCLKQDVYNFLHAWSYGAAGTYNNKSVYPRA